MAQLSPGRIGLVLSGAFLAGVAATVLQAVGVSPAYAVVVGLSGAMPILLEGMRPSDDSPDTGTRLQRAAAEITGALFVGMFGAFALVLADVSDAILVVGATLGAYVGGMFARSAIRSGADESD